VRFSRREALALGAAAPLSASAGETKTLFVAPPSALVYDPGPGRWDRPERIAAIDAALAGEPFGALLRAEAPRAPGEALLRAHDAAYIARIAAGLPTGVDDAPMSPGAFEAAMRAAGGAVLAVDAVMRGAAKNAFVATRPPGHHALPGAPMGFCFFNNAAVAARQAMATHGAERVAIVDFDVHHGNGAQQIFWDEKNVLYCSTHQMPLYPGTGAVSERGAFDNIVNAPLAKGGGGEAFRTAFGERILPRLNAFGPDIIIVCAGFDARLHDPLGGLRLVESDFAEVTLCIMEIAARRCGGRVVSLLEGGYRPENLAACVAAHLGALMRA
jgi:acetoin utilization deacetylase AcuC-like enzyme